jgi:hypothetical protein
VWIQWEKADVRRVSDELGDEIDGQPENVAKASLVTLNHRRLNQQQ